MKKTSKCIALIFLAGLTGYCQEINKWVPFPRGLVTHDANVLTVEAQEARPLRQASAALCSEYGWMLDYEDPIYTASDLVDATNDKWRQTRPFAHGVVIPVGGHFLFSTVLPDLSELNSGQACGRILRQMVQRYNSTGNPGHLALLDSGNRRFAIAGSLQNGITGVFGLKVVPAQGDQTIDHLLASVLAAVSGQLGKPVKLGFVPMNALRRKAPSTAGGSEVLARTAIANALDATHSNLVYEALYDANLDG